MNDTKPSKNIIREFGLSSFAVDNSTSVFIVVLLIILMGASAYMTIAKESYPEIVLPTIRVGVAYPGNAPLDIENLITRPIEKELNSITGVNEINSTSVQDYSNVIIEFDIDVAVEKALREVKDAVDRAKGDLPNDLPREPEVLELNFSNFPIMNINVSGSENLDVLKNYAEYLQEEIEKLSEITRVDISGVPDKELTINVNIYELESRVLNFEDIENAIKSENLTMSGGDLLTDDLRRNIRIVGEFKSLEEIENIVINYEDGNTVYLKDVATVKFGYEDRESYARVETKPVVILDVIKRSSENILDASAKINKLVADAKEKKFPKELEVQIINDQSKQTRSMLSNLENSIIAGVILVVLILQFFLGLRNALFVGTAIPLSMLMAFMILGFSGNTLNVMVLFSLILALGMLVDNGIVVVENIYRLMQEGRSSIQAAKEGVGEVAWPIITSTATTLAAFLPLLFWNDIMGEFMKFLPLTLIMVLTSSLFVGLIINPVLTAVFMKIDGENDKLNHRNVWLTFAVLAILATVFYVIQSTLIGSLFAITAVFMVLNAYLLAPFSRQFQNVFLPKLEDAYRRFTHFALTGFRPYLFFAATIALLVASIALLGTRDMAQSLFPVTEPNSTYVYIEFPVGADIEKTNTFTKKVEDIVRETVAPYRHMIESVMGQVGENTGNPMRSFEGTASPNKSRVTIGFLEYQYRQGVSTLTIMEEVRHALKGFPGVKVTLGQDDSGPPVGLPINVEVVGEDYETLIKLAKDVKRTMEEANIPGTEELQLDLETGKPELMLTIDRENARRYGLSTFSIADGIRSAVFGKEVSQYKDGEDEYPIQLRFNEQTRYDLPTLLNQKITFRNKRGRMVQVPISAVAHVEYTSTYGAVKRKNLDRVITVFSDVVEGYNGNDVVTKYKRLLANYELPEGYEMRFTGEQQEQAESAAFLMKAMGIAVMLIFLIIVSQFNSVAMPFIIVLSVLFSTIGVFLGYFVFNMDFIIIMTGIGIISLAGVVVNNAIVLIDYTNLVRNRKRLELNLDETGGNLTRQQLIDSIVEAGSKRLRPVLLTAITTVLGLVPLATGLNIDFGGLLTNFDPNIYVGGDNAIFWGPMAWTVIFGLVFATFLTLVIVPIMYLGVDRLSARFLGGGIAGRKKD